MKDAKQGPAVWVCLSRSHCLTYVGRGGRTPPALLKLLWALMLPRSAQTAPGPQAKGSTLAGHTAVAAVTPRATLPTYPRAAARAGDGLWQASAPSPGFDHEVLQLSGHLGTILACSASFGYFKHQIDVFFCLSKSISYSGFNAI